jgi:hypothetical protein
VYSLIADPVDGRWQAAEKAARFRAECLDQPRRAHLELAFLSARISANAGVVQRRRRWWLGAKSLKTNKRCNAGVAGSGLQNRGLLVRFQPGLLRT